MLPPEGPGGLQPAPDPARAAGVLTPAPRPATLRPGRLLPVARLPTSPEGTIRHNGYTLAVVD